jgi:hypothetical protein
LKRTRGGTPLREDQDRVAGRGDLGQPAQTGGAAALALEREHAEQQRGELPLRRRPGGALGHRRHD